MALRNDALTQHGWQEVSNRKKKIVREQSVTSSQVRRLVSDYYCTDDLKMVLGDDDVAHLVALLTYVEKTYIGDDMVYQLRIVHKDKRRMKILTHDSITPLGVLLRLKALVCRLKTQTKYSFTDVGHVVAVFYTLMVAFPSCVPAVYESFA